MGIVTDTYRRMPNFAATVIAAIVSWALATVVAALSGFLAIYAYDRGRSKGDDLFVGLAAAHIVGVFALVLLFSWLVKLHHQVTAETPTSVLVVGFVGTAVNTYLMWDSGYGLAIFLAWMFIVPSGLLAWWLSVRMIENATSSGTLAQGTHVGS